MFMFDTKVANIRPYLLLGAAVHEQDYALLRSEGVTHILQGRNRGPIDRAAQIGSELRTSYPDRFQYLRISIDDAEYEDILRHLPRCFEFIDSARRQTGVESGSAQEGGAPAPTAAPTAAAPTPGSGSGSGKVLVHCMAGMSRSATCVVAYLMWAERLPYAEAFKQVKAARPCIYPNLGFLLQVWEWEAGGCNLHSWQGWNKHKFAERLAEYRQAQAAAGLHPAVRVQLPLPSFTAPDGPTLAAAGEGTPGGASSHSPRHGGRSRRPGGVTIPMTAAPSPVAAAAAAGGEAPAAAGAAGAASGQEERDIEAAWPQPPLPPQQELSAAASEGIAAADGGGDGDAGRGSGQERSTGSSATDPRDSRDLADGAILLPRVLPPPVAPPLPPPPPPLALPRNGSFGLPGVGVGVGVGAVGLEVVQC